MMQTSLQLDLPLTRAEARVAGQKTYNGGKLCPKCGGSERIAVSGQCIMCHKQWRQDHGKWSREQVAQKTGAQTRRAEAAAAKQKTYQGSPCRTCGATEKYVINQSCTVCTIGKSRVKLDDSVLMAPYRTPEKKNKFTKKWRKKNPEKVVMQRARTKSQRLAHYQRHKDTPLFRARELKKYGFTVEQFDSLLASQGGGCAICDDKTGNSKGYRLGIDHDHSTGDVRGILCGRCNSGLGQFRDNLASLMKAVAYLGGVV